MIQKNQQSCNLLVVIIIKYKLKMLGKGSKRLDQNHSDEQQGDAPKLSTIDLGSYRKKRPSSYRNGNYQNINSWKGIFYFISAVIVIAILIYYFNSKCKTNSFANEEEAKLKIKDLQDKIKEKQQRQALLQKKQLEDKQKIAKILQEQLTLTKKIQDLTTQLNKVGVKTQPSKPKETKDDKQPSKAQITSKGQEPNVIIDIKYDSNQYLPLPINPLHKDANNKGVADAIYKDDQMRKKRDQFIQQRITFINSKTSFPSLFLAKYNFISTEQMLKEAIAENQKEWLRLEAKFKLSALKEQLPICVVVPGYNNNANFRIQGDLNSVFTQNYTNYKVVVVDDASTDGSGQLYQKYFNFYRIDKSRYFFVENTKRATALQNIYQVSVNQCSKDSVVITMDGDDEFIGRNVLNVFNWAYQTKKAGVVYSNFYWYQQPQTLMYGFTSQYTQNQRKNNLYRGSPQRFSQLRSYRAQLARQINPKDLQDEKGVFFTIAYDMALFFPLMELSCGRVSKIDGEFHYLYNIGTGINDYQDRGRQVAVDNRVRAQKKYECFKQFDERMNK